MQQLHWGLLSDHLASRRFCAISGRAHQPRFHPRANQGRHVNGRLDLVRDWQTAQGAAVRANKLAWAIEVGRFLIFGGALSDRASELDQAHALGLQRFKAAGFKHAVKMDRSHLAGIAALQQGRMPNYKSRSVTGLDARRHSHMYPFGQTSRLPSGPSWCSLVTDVNAGIGCRTIATQGWPVWPVCMPV